MSDPGAGESGPRDSGGMRLEAVVMSFVQGGRKLEVLNGAAFSVAAGEMVALVGPSGAGKSTLLHIAGLLERPEAGEITIAGTACSGLPDGRRTELRRDSLGFVYQYHHLLPEFSAVENVLVPQMIAGRGRGEAREAALKLLASVGLEARADHRPGQLSGGEQQRVAIARALANGPSVLLADEPTGNLDPHTAADVFEILIARVRQAGLAALIATHNPVLAGRMDRILSLEDGRIV